VHRGERDQRLGRLAPVHVVRDLSLRVGRLWLQSAAELAPPSTATPRRRVPSRG
jgi:hypothetical protein